MKKIPYTTNSVEDLLTLARDLRDKDGGCPWDIEQTHQSLAKYLLEESSELIDVIEAGITQANIHDFKEELGDVLFQVVIHAQLAQENNFFNFYDVARTVTDKLTSRHPHVYGSTQAKNTQQVLNTWEKIKKEEREKKQSLEENLPSAGRSDNLWPNHSF
ncbi:MAG TPA: MazG nucleotide pyrophosphohydrolase domain-containing protein, partial [Turneriella sp.]|nr:MazG nucleotide pyrophosphohydrolase domain-containing protein [Turneriella sp.]